jgi:NAD(P)-dependent dehydrogenase (short-subunit alcohol dehydrogenase family)
VAEASARSAIGKVILVTGGCGDLGRATVQALVAEGASVVASDLYPPDEARAAGRLGRRGRDRALRPRRRARAP